jgi:hypothetical protein
MTKYMKLFTPPIIALGVLALATPAYADNPCRDTRACNAMPADPPQAATPDAQTPPVTDTTPAPAPETVTETAPVPGPDPAEEAPTAPATNGAAPPAPPARDVPEGTDGSTSAAASKPAGVGTESSATAPATDVSAPVSPATAAAPATGVLAASPVPTAVSTSPALPRESVRAPLGSSLQRTGVAGMLVFVSALIGAFTTRRRVSISEIPGRSTSETPELVTEEVPAMAEVVEETEWITDIEHYLEIAATFSAERHHDRSY